MAHLHDFSSIEMEFFSYIYFVQEILTCTFIRYLDDIIRHCSNDTLFPHFHKFLNMRWPTSPLALYGPVPYRLYDRDTHLLSDMYLPVL